MSLPVLAPASAQAAHTLQEHPQPASLLTPGRQPLGQTGTAHSNVSLTAGEEPMALVFKTAVDGMNEQLGGQTSTAVVAQDASPQVTSARIVAMSVAFYHAFRMQHLGDPEDLVLQEFMQAIRRGIDSGFGEARTVLRGLDALDAPTAAAIDVTYLLVQDGLAGLDRTHAGALALAA